MIPASWNDQSIFSFTHCVSFLKIESITLRGIIRPIWTISKYLGLSENQTDSSLPSQLPPAAIRGQKSPAGLISWRKCGGNLSITLSLKHPQFSPDIIWFPDYWWNKWEIFSFREFPPALSHQGLLSFICIFFFWSGNNFLAALFHISRCFC